MGDIDFSRISALAIEDDAGGLAIISAFMRRMGIKTHIDCSGAHIPERLRELTPAPSIIFVDLKLRNRTGFEILQEIRADEQFKDMTVIAVTAMDASIAMPMCKEAGFDGYIAKPLRRIRFIEQFERILNGEPVWDAS